MTKYGNNIMTVYGIVGLARTHTSLYPKRPIYWPKMAKVKKKYKSLFVGFYQIEVVYLQLLRVA